MPDEEQLTYTVSIEIERSDGASTSVEMAHIPADEVAGVVNQAKLMLTRLKKMRTPGDNQTG